MHQSKIRGFTLVELIIVITILAVLVTIAFVSFQSYTRDARDANRISNLQNIQSGLALFFLKTNTYPEISSGTSIVGNGNTIGYQGNFGDNESRLININITPLDPKTAQKYIYRINTRKTAYQAGIFLENQNTNTISSTGGYFLSEGNDLGIILNTSDNSLPTGTAGQLDLTSGASGSSFNVFLTNYTSRYQGINLFGPLDFLGYKNGDMRAPKNCDYGYVGVNGNKEFLQPGFCVMKYEASHKTINSNANTTCTSASGPTRECNIPGNTLTSNDITSRYGALPINYITQQKAISLCSGIGNGYHLITNNEWMTLSRQIEKNALNWSNGKIGSGAVYRGNTIPPSGSNNSISCGAEYTNYTQSPSSDTSNLGYQRTTCSEKRQLILENGQIIWDIAGNLWEHVNKANTKDGTLYDIGLTKFDETTGSWGGSYANRHNADGWSTASIDSATRGSYGPSNSSYGNTQGMGNIKGWGAKTSNIFIRGEGGYGDDQAGIYTLFLQYTNADSQQADLGFRCAY